MPFTLAYFVIGAVVTILLFFFASAFVVSRRRPQHDPVKGSEVETIYAMVSQLVQPSTIDQSFYESYQSEISRRYQDLDHRVLSNRSIELYNCANSLATTLTLLKTNLKTTLPAKRAFLVAEAIIVAMRFDQTQAFSRAARGAYPAIYHNYKQILSTLELTGRDIADAFILLKAEEEKLLDTATNVSAILAEESLQPVMSSTTGTKPSNAQIKAQATAKADPKAKATAKADTKSEAESAAKAEPKSEAKAADKADTKSVAKAEPKPAAQAEPKSTATAETKSEAKTESKAETDADSKDQTAPESKAQANTETKAKAETKPSPKAETTAATKSEAKTEAKVSTETETNTETKPETATAAKTNAETSGEAKPEAKVESKVEAKLEAKAEAKVESKVETNPEAKVEKKPEARVESKVESKVEAKPEAKDKAQQQLATANKAGDEAEANKTDSGKAETTSANKPKPKLRATTTPLQPLKAPPKSVAPPSVLPTTSFGQHKKKIKAAAKVVVSEHEQAANVVTNTGLNTEAPSDISFKQPFARKR